MWVFCPQCNQSNSMSRVGSHLHWLGWVALCSADRKKVSAVTGNLLLCGPLGSQCGNKDWNLWANFTLSSIHMQCNNAIIAFGWPNKVVWWWYSGAMVGVGVVC